MASDINGLITLGIGPESAALEHFILDGLNGVAVAAPVEGDSGGGGGGGGPTRPRYIRIGPPARLIRLRGGIGARGRAEGKLSVERPLPAFVGTRLMLGGALYAERRLIGGGTSASLHVQAALQIETWAQREAGLRAQLVEAQRKKRMMESAMRALRTQLDDARAGVEAEEELIISLIMR